MRTALITGVAGQDGAYLSRRLRSEGTRVVGVSPFVHLDPDLAPFLVGVELIQGDVSDPDLVEQLLVDLAPDELYNLAGVSSVARSWEDPRLSARVNGEAVIAMLDAVSRLSPTTRFLQASSAEIFGEPTSSTQDESTPVAPCSPYGAAKALGHHAVQIYRRARRLHATNLVLYNHESPLRPTSFVTRKVTRTAAAIALGLQDELVLGDIDIRRDWGYAGDYVDAMVRAARQDSGDDYVIATGESHSLRDFVETAFRHAGVSDWHRYVRCDQALIRPADIGHMVGRPDKAARQLGWRHTTSFNQLVEMMVEHDLAQLSASAGET